MKSIIEEGSQIPEMYTLRHKHDNILNDGYNYTDNALIRSVTPVMYNNDNLSTFLDKLNKMYISMVETILPVRNIFYWSHNRYFNGHGK